MGGITTIINKVKYIGIASLTIAILSILILNIISSYSSSKIESNAIDSNNEPSTLANDSSTCDPTNTNAAACISMSITSSSSSTGGNDANLSLSIPQGGGIATGRHTVSVSSNNVAGYYVMLTGNAGSPAMTPSATTSQAFIQSTTGTLANPTYLDKGQWGSWGIALPNSSLYTGFNTNEMDYSSTDQDVLHKTTWAAVPGKESDDSDKTIIKTTASSKKTDSYPIYYGVRVDSPVSVPADTYAAQVVYTATTNEVLMPTITSTSRNTYELGSGADSTVTITGTNLASTYKVYIESNADSTKQYDITSTVTNLTDTGLTVTIPTDQTNTDLEPGDYTIHVVTQGGEGSTGFSYTKKTLPDGILESTDDYGDDGHVAVDYDENMIPVKFSSSSYGAPTVTAIPRSEIESDPSVWYDYSSDKKQWANAVTVENPDDYKNITKETTVQDSDILGYWVYIPRYAYKVMRRDASDMAISDTTASRNGGFEIKFETANDFKKTPVKCNQSSSSTAYQTCISSQEGADALNYPTDPADKDSTVWATHPAFSWGTEVNGYEEMNGFWIGKFETTEGSSSGGYPYPSSSTPTILPGQPVYKANSWSGIGDMYDTAKKFGIEDKNNTYSGDSLSGGYPGYPGSSTTISQNAHHLSVAMSHMIKNNEWGAILYLASSKFGIGINSVEPNSSLATTACGPSANSEDDCYITNSDAKRASTTGTEYGVFDITGGTFEPVMAAYGRANTPISSDGFRSVPRPPYAQIYAMGNTASCTWETCGGDATYETSTSTINGPSSSSDGSPQQIMWDGGLGMFVDNTYPWVVRSMMGGYDSSSPDVCYSFIR